MRIPALLGSVARSRQWSVRLARSHGACDTTVQVVELLTSEVVTNAVKYGRVTGTVELHLDRDADVLRVSVGDDNPTPPRVLAHSGVRAGGQGMRLVAQLAEAWGWCPARGGKSVWFTVPLV